MSSPYQFAGSSTREVGEEGLARLVGCIQVLAGRLKSGHVTPCFGENGRKEGSESCGVREESLGLVSRSVEGGSGQIVTIEEPELLKETDSAFSELVERRAVAKGLLACELCGDVNALTEHISFLIFV
jgi:hypothetical protein